MRAVARQLQHTAAADPLSRAAPEGQAHDPKYFARVDRELLWGLTLNK